MKFCDSRLKAKGQKKNPQENSYNQNYSKAQVRQAAKQCCIFAPDAAQSYYAVTTVTNCLAIFNSGSFAKSFINTSLTRLGP